jgi:hypothetical protein
MSTPGAAQRPHGRLNACVPSSSPASAGRKSSERAVADARQAFDVPDAVDDVSALALVVQGATTGR